MSRRKATGQFDLFAPTPSDPTAPPPEPVPLAAPARGLDAFPGDALIDFLTLHLYGKPPADPPLLPLIGELSARRERRALPLLLRVCRRFADPEGDRPAPELLAALSALAALGDSEAGAPLMDLVREGRHGPAETAAVVDCLGALRYRPATALLPELAADPRPVVRQAACRFAEALAPLDDLGPLLPLASDPDRAVARAACLALGRLGHGPVKAALEEMLVRATPVELPAVVESLLPVADEDTPVVLGRVAERSDEAGRRTIVDALGSLRGEAAVTALGRLARDGKPAVRQAVAEALAGFDPDRKVAAILGPLAQDRDPAVRQAAEEALKAFDEGW